MARRRPRIPSKRRAPKRESYDRVLIVCEGSKSEPFYFNDIKDRYKLSAANVKVTSKDSAPASVVERAIQLQNQERRFGEKYDKVVCVFDRDEHSSFDEACAKAKGRTFGIVRSWPCFEFWLLLHFRYSRKPYARSGDRSPADECISDLKDHLPNYEKAQKGLFRQLEARIEAAKTNGRQTIVDAKETNDPNPSTEIHLLVDYMQNLKPDV